METRLTRGRCGRLATLALSIALTVAAAPVAGDPRFEAKVAAVKAEMLADPTSAIRSAEEALRYADASRVATMRATARWLLGEGYSRIDEPARAAPLLAEARRLVERAAPGSRLHADVLLSEGGVFTATGDISRALGDLHKAHELFITLNDARSQAKSLIMIALVYANANDHANALRYFGQADEAYRADPGLSVAILNGRGNALRELGRLSAADAEFRKALTMAEQMKGPVLIARVLANIARVQLLRGDLDGAERTIDHGMIVTRQPEAESYRSTFLALGAQKALRDGAIAEAGRLIDQRFAGVEIDRTLLYDRDAHETAYQIYTRLGRDGLALRHLAALKRLDDQATQMARSNSAALAAAKFDFANQELRIANLRAADLQKTVQFERARTQTQRSIFIAAAVTTLFVIALLGFGLFTIRRSRNALAVSNTALGKALAAKTEFLATTSHEIRTPLNGILGMTQVMLADPKVDDTTRDRLSVLQGAGVTMRALVDDILDVAKMETGKMTIEREPIDARRTIVDAARMWDEQARGKGLSFTADLDDAPQWILGDSARLRQIVFNLLSNAVKFTPSGSVRIAARCDGDRWRLEVADTGIGIAADQHEEIFEAFRQADSGTTRQFGGTGLGLSICRNLSRAMGGDVTVASEPGRGAVFTLDLPMERVASPEAAPEAGAGILILDRNPIARAMMKALLEPRGGPASFAATLDEARERIGDAVPATILIDDATMRAGGDIVALIAALAAAAPRATIALLGPPLPQNELDALLSAGLDRAITKPIGKDALVAALFDGDEPSATALVPRAA